MESTNLKIGDIVKLDFDDGLNKVKHHKAVVLALKSEQLSETIVGLFDDQGWARTYITDNFQLIKRPSPVIKYKAYIALCKFINNMIESNGINRRELEGLSTQFEELRKLMSLAVAAKERCALMLSEEIDEHRKDGLKDIMALLRM